jgi:hypothetical protein
MKSLFTPNLNNTGRLVRGTGALALLIGAGLGFPHSRALGVVLAVSGLFVLFEALRGWCVLRACGFKTRL